ncbi:hypothetical protein [Blastococcus mobilis]|uniref:Core-binding (CB) domain-containing protein n=1 Tax=Blastococcus mobilis TaxID=1938746 RepID=A0A238VZR3_9ACTN|nr:hypothetical protein [Blastococcus mobilis]SNR39835.1 hypothetical protein SAMN06272737_105218 [Blastococcus mobilis]
MTTPRHGLVEVPLALHLRFEGDEPLRLDLSHLPCPGVVRPLALALLSLTNAGGTVKTAWTAKKYRDAIGRFARWLDDDGFRGDLRDLTVERLYDYWQQEKRDVENRNRILLAAATPTAGVSRPVPSDVTPHLAGRRVSAENARSTPLAAYSHGEYTRLVAKCKEIVRAARVEQRRVAALLSETGPSAGGSETWLRWLAGSSLDSVEVLRQRHPDGWLVDSDAFRAYRRALLPDMDTALAYRVLLGLEFGLPPESMNALMTADFEWQGKRQLRVAFRKRRASDRQAMGYRETGPWSGPALLRDWLRTSERLRSLMDDESQLWICFTEAGGGAVADFADWRWGKHRRRFIERTALTDDDGQPLPLDLRRLRTTWTERKGRDWHGAVTIDPNRTATVEGDHYLTRSADPEVMAETVEAAQQDLLRRAETVALILTDDERLADAVDGPDVLRRREARSTSGEWDMFAATCRDPYDSPFVTKGNFCTASVWSCLVCPLAVITPAKLPNLLRLEAYIRRRADDLPQSEWLSVYGAAWVQLTTRILPRYSAAALHQANAVIADETAALPLGPGEQLA